MAISITKSPVLDQIELSVGLKTKALVEEFGDVLRNLWKQRKVLLPAGKMTFAPKPNVKRLGYYPDQKRLLASIEVGVTKSGHAYHKISLWPAKFQGDDFEIFKAIYDQFFLPFTYQHIFAKGNVTRVDLAIDTLSHPIWSLIPFRGKSHKSHVYMGGTLEQGSIYLGTPNSDTQWCIYDKNKQLMDSGFVVQHKFLTRFEVRLRHLGCSAQELLSDIGSPFISLEIADKSLAYKQSPDPVWTHFLFRCDVIGASLALNQLDSKQLRKKFLERLRQPRAWWWNPAKYHAQPALQVIAP